MRIAISLYHYHYHRYIVISLPLSSLYRYIITIIIAISLYRYRYHAAQIDFILIRTQTKGFSDECYVNEAEQIVIDTDHRPVMSMKQTRKRKKKETA